MVKHGGERGGEDATTLGMMTVGELREFIVDLPADDLVAVPCRDPDDIDAFLEPLPVTDIVSYPGIITLDVEGVS